jgi:hypothetical protein
MVTTAGVPASEPSAVPAPSIGHNDRELTAVCPAAPQHAAIVAAPDDNVHADAQTMTRRAYRLVLK